MEDIDSQASHASWKGQIAAARGIETPIAIVEDEDDIAELVEMHLRKAGFATVAFSDGSSFLSYIQNNTPALVILDIMLPDVQGTDLCRAVRASERLGSIPVIMLTALGHETEKVLGLELGADDYIVKPFSPRELVARVRAVLRRSQARGDTGKEVKWDSLTLFPESFKACLNSDYLDLTPTEFRILQALVEGRGRVLSRGSLLDLLWEGEKFVFERTIDVHIAHIREKLGESGAMIGSVRGVGYRMER